VTGVASLTDEDPIISNCLFWDNHDSGGETESAQISVQDCNPVISYTLIQGLNLYAAGVGNIGQDPMFVSSDDQRLRAGSPAIDAGDPDTVPAADETDLDGADRIQYGRIDMGAYEFTAAGDPRAEMTTPADSGDTLTGSSFTFQWTTGTDVTEYWLWLGTVQGQNDILSQGSGTSTSLAVTGLPTDGSTIYARLFSMIDGEWQTNDYNYVTFYVPSTAAVMTTPASSGDTLTGSSFTFQWTTGSSVTEYWLWVGSTQGNNDMFSQGSGTSTSITASGLPTDGSTVYVRLFSMIAGQWQTNDYNYVAYTAP
jgi:hypothetical protein